MAQQPIPAVGSVTFFIHITVIGFSKLKKVKRNYWVFLFIFLLVVIALFKNRNLIFNSLPAPKKQHAVKLNEKNEPITDTGFVNNMHFSAWLPWWDEQRVVQSLGNAQGKLEEISPIWYKLSDNGLLDTNPSVAKDIITQRASSSGMILIPTINNETNSGFDPKRVSFFLQNKNVQTTFINTLIASALQNGYKGWDIDWEQKNPKDKDAFTGFIQSLADALHTSHLQLTVTVQAKTGDAKNPDENTAEDWKALSPYADHIRIMAYDFHYDTSDPGAITPLDDLEAVLDYAVKEIPKDKIALGLPLYGYDWDNKKGEAIQYEDGMKRIKQYKGSFEYDSQSEEVVGKYTTLITPHTLWFTDTKSILRMLYIAYNYDVTNIIFWRLGGEDPTLWKLK